MDELLIKIEIPSLIYIKKKILGLNLIHFNNFLNNWEIFLKYSQPTILSDRKIPVYLQFTRNSNIKILEPLIPSLDKSFSQLEQLVEITSPEHIMWRFDPIPEGDVTVSYPFVFST